jgi:hypothetical protein
MPLSAAALGVLVFAAWPRDASAATIQRLIRAIDNAKTMDSTMVYNGPSGKLIPFMRLSYESGRWRRELLVNSPNRSIYIYKDEMCYENYIALDHATIRSVTEADRLPIQGGALEVVKEEFQHFAGHSAVLTTASSPDVRGRAAYRVLMDRKSDGRHVEIVVDKANDLPLSADTWSKLSQQHTHTDYVFNKQFPQGFFDLEPSRKVVDIRKTIPARIATWSNPIASINGFDVLDAQVTRDGIVWLVTKSVQGKRGGIQAQDLECANGGIYAKGPSCEVPGQPIQISSFIPLDKKPLLPVKGTLSLDSIFWPERPSSMPEESYPAGKVTPGGKLTFPIGSSQEATRPAYVVDLGIDHELFELQYWNDFGRAEKLQMLGRWREAGQVLEHIGDQVSPDFGGYESWMKQAAQCYQKAGAEADRKRVEQKIAHPDYSKPIG